MRILSICANFVVESGAPDGAGRQLPRQDFVRASGFSREGRNYGAPEPDAYEPEKVLQSPRYALLHATFILSM